MFLKFSKTRVCKVSAASKLVGEILTGAFDRGEYGRGGGDVNRHQLRRVGFKYKIADIYDILSKLFRFWGNNRPG